MSHVEHDVECGPHTHETRLSARHVAQRRLQRGARAQSPSHCSLLLSLEAPGALHSVAECWKGTLAFSQPKVRNQTMLVTRRPGRHRTAGVHMTEVPISTPPLTNLRRNSSSDSIILVQRLFGDIGARTLGELRRHVARRICLCTQRAAMH